MKKSLKYAIVVFVLIELLGLTVMWASKSERGEGMAAILIFTHFMAIGTAGFVAGPLAAEIDNP